MRLHIITQCVDQPAGGRLHHLPLPLEGPCRPALLLCWTCWAYCDPAIPWCYLPASGGVWLEGAPGWVGWWWRVVVAPYRARGVKPNTNRQLTSSGTQLHTYILKTHPLITHPHTHRYTHICTLVRPHSIHTIVYLVIYRYLNLFMYLSLFFSVSLLLILLIIWRCSNIRFS